MLARTTLLVPLAVPLAALARAQEVAPAPAAEAPVASAPADLGPLLEPLRAQYELPALGGAVVAGDALVGLGAVGLRRVDGEVAVDPGDLWHLGSCTKSMTATWIALLVEREELAWDTKLGAVFTDLAEEGEIDVGWDEVTLEQLLSNSSGAPASLDAGGLWARLWLHEGTPRQQRRALVEGVLARPPEAPPGTRYVYSNAGFAIAAAMAETAVDGSFEERIRAELFEPLGMASAGFGAPGAAGEVAQPFGHSTREGKLVPVELGPGDDNPSAIAPAGKVHAALADWARYAALHLAGARGEEGLLLESGTFEKLHAPRFGDYAMGWVVREERWADGQRVLWHNGSNTMWYCEIAIVPDADCAVMVAANRGDGRVRRAVGEALRELYEHQVRGR